MSIKNFLIGSIVGGIVLFLLGWLIYGVIMGGGTGMDTDLGWKAEPDILMIFFSELVTAMIITLVIGAWGKMTTFQAGAVAGAVVGALMSLMFGFAMMAFRTDMEWGWMALDTGITFVRCGIAGGIIAWVLTKV